jgi:hypothetical protein
MNKEEAPSLFYLEHVQCSIFIFFMMRESKWLLAKTKKLMRKIIDGNGE